MRSPTHSLISVLGAGLLLAPLLAGCAAEIDPEATVESLTEVTADPEPPANVERYDAELEPEPIVEPLDCSRYLVITVRGTGEPAKKQLLAPVTKTISAARPGEVQVLDLDYPADTEVKDGGTLGARKLVDTLKVQSESCPDQSFVLLGYSQGALVVGDALAAPEHRLVGLRVGEVPEAAAERVLAVVLFGNPRFLAAEPYSVGTFDPEVNGLLPRPAGGLAEYADRTRDYCAGKDMICQTALTTEIDDAGHVSYYKNGMPQDGAAFVVTKLFPIDEESKRAQQRHDKAEQTKRDAAKPEPSTTEPSRGSGE